MKYTNYAYKEGLTAGIGNSKFGANDNMIAKSYMTFLLRALGYDDEKGDFQWASAIEFAKDIDLVSDEFAELVNSEVFIRDYIAKSSYECLFTNKKDSETSLVSFLIESEDIDENLGNEMTNNRIFPDDDYGKYEDTVLSIRKSLISESISLSKLISEYEKDDPVLWNLVKGEINRVSDWYDFDNDGLLDYLEIVRYNTNPNSIDTDGDGIVDNQENEFNEYCYYVTGKIQVVKPYDSNGIDIELVAGNDSLVSRYNGDSNFLEMYGDKNLSFEEKLELMSFGEVMFEEEIVGNCTATSNLFASMTKAMGIPTRVVVSFPMFSSEDSIDLNDVITNNVVLTSINHDEVEPGQYVNVPGPTSDHWYLEYYIGIQWVTFDSAVEGLSITITSIADYSTFDHYSQWMDNVEYNDSITDNLILLEAEENYPLYKGY